MVGWVKGFEAKSKEVTAMMYFLEILTDVGVYTAQVHGCGNDEERGQDEAFLFNDARGAALSGDFMYGWTPTDDSNTDVPCIFAIEKDARVISTKLYMSANATDRVNEVSDMSNRKVYDIAFDGEYLGNRVHITGIGISTEDAEYLMPLYANGTDVCDIMTGSVLARQVQLWKEEQGAASDSYRIIIPDVSMVRDVAEDYLTDYINEAAPQTRIHGDGNAKAWFGWNET